MAYGDDMTTAERLEMESLDHLFRVRELVGEWFAALDAAERSTSEGDWSPPARLCFETTEKRLADAALELALHFKAGR